MQIQPYLFFDGRAEEAIEFYKKALGAEERMRFEGPGGSIMHAELKIGDSVIMLADEAPDWGALGPGTVGGTPVTIHVYVEDVDDVFAKALAAGATEVRAVSDEFYGDRSGQFNDPWGHRWNIATHVEDVPPEEMAERAKASMG